MVQNISMHIQAPLIHVINDDDELLYNSEHSTWYRIIKDFPDGDYREIAANYYNCLYHFNLSCKQTKPSSTQNDETKDQAKQRLLFDRPTMDESQPVMFEKPDPPVVTRKVTPDMIGPGITPNRLAGKKPKCFFALYKSFIGASLMGFESEPEKVHFLLMSNLSFARVCGFIPKNENSDYWHKHVPSLRKIQQFDQIMTDYGLWDVCKRNEVMDNIAQGFIKKENEIVGDTTHYKGLSGFETVPYINEKGKKKGKSQSKVTKNCRCKNREQCPHDWQLTDDGAGTIVKAHNRYIWGHKASILGLPIQGIPLDALAVSDASTNDRNTFFPHVVKLLEDHPILSGWIDTALYDSACDDEKLRAKFDDELGITLKASLNPRRKKEITKNLPKFMKKLTPYGTLTCEGGFEMDFKGARYRDDMFIFGAPVVDGMNACASCCHKPACCPNAKNGRTTQISFDLLSHINPTDPPMAKRFKALMTRRPSVERMIKRLKCDLGDDRLKKRGNKSFQAYLDKTMIAFHILLRN